jgi:hypothetical protein
MRRLYLFAIGLVGVAIVVWRLVIPPVQDGKDPANQQRVVTRTGPEGRIVTIDTDTVPECAACVVTTPARARLGRLEDPVLLRNIPIIESDSRGNFFAAVAGARDHDIIMYDPDGNVVRTVGRFGSGPGEFRIVWDLYIDRHDTLYVGHDSRLSVFDSAGAFVRGVRLVPRNQALVRRSWLSMAATLSSPRCDMSRLATPSYHHCTGTTVEEYL